MKFTAVLALLSFAAYGGTSQLSRLSKGILPMRSLWLTLIVLGSRLPQQRLPDCLRESLRVRRQKGLRLVQRKPELPDSLRISPTEVMLQVLR